MPTPDPARRHIRLTSHPGQGSAGAPPICWGAADPLQRGPIVGNTTHGGRYGVYRALAVAAGNLTRGHRADKRFLRTECVAGVQDMPFQEIEPDALIPADAKVETEAKVAAGYFTDGPLPSVDDLAHVQGRSLE